MEYTGYSKAQNGTLYLIGIGPEQWLRDRMHAGCTELVLLPAEKDEPVIEYALLRAERRL